MIKWPFRWTRKSKYGHIVAAGKVCVCVCVSRRDEAHRLVPHRLVDRGTDKL